MSDCVHKCNSDKNCVAITFDASNTTVVPNQKNGDYKGTDYAGGYSLANCFLYYVNPPPVLRRTSDCDWTSCFKGNYK